MSQTSHVAILLNSPLNFIDFLLDLGLRAAVEEHIPRALLSVLADMCLDQANLTLSESHLKSLINIFDLRRNYPQLSSDSKYSHERIRRLLEKIKLSGSELVNEVMNLNLESRFGGPAASKQISRFSKYRGLISSRQLWMHIPRKFFLFRSHPTENFLFLHHLIGQSEFGTQRRERKFE